MPGGTEPRVCLPARIRALGRDARRAPGDAAATRRSAAADVETLLSELLAAPRAKDRGASLGGTGVLHTTSVWRDQAGALRVLRIGEDTPRSECDRFLLGAARARAAVLLTSGSILRAEPDLRHELHPDRATAAALASWRRRLGLAQPPALAVLSRGEIPLDHPALGGACSVVLLTEPAAAARLRAEGARRSRSVPDRLHVEALEPCDARVAVAWLRSRFGRVTVELGPGAARELYRPPAAVDELWLARYDEPVVPVSVLGGALASEEALTQALPASSGPVPVLEASGRWLFERRCAYRGER